ncbi:MAG: LPP20 family lipoprotein [Sulfurimonas sp.]|nr:LPP20 family lipoprotein [Sulfurimonas sp.]
MSKIIYKIIMIFSLLFLSACGIQKEIDLNQNKKLPSWYENPPKTTISTLYSIGEGENRDDAIANGLSNMISTLSVSISSQFNSKTVVKEGSNNSFQSTVTNDIQSDVKKIRISNYEVQEAKKLGFRRYIVLINSDKKKLFDSLKSEIEQKFTLIEKEKEKLNNYNAIKQLAVLKESKNSIDNVLDNLVVMNVLNNSFNSKEYVNRVKDVSDDYEKILSSITFSISSNEIAKNLEAPISSGLSNEKLQIKNSRGKKHFHINIFSKNNQANSHGFIIIRSAIEIRVIDFKGSIVGSNKLNIIGRSTQGIEVAKEGVAIKLNEMIKKDGIGKVIGLEL